MFTVSAVTHRLSSLWAPLAPLAFFRTTHFHTFPNLIEQHDLSYLSCMGYDDMMHGYDVYVLYDNLMISRIGVWSL